MKYRKKWQTCSIAVILTLSTLSNVNGQTAQLLRITQLRQYPSASAAEWHHGRLYLMGDDAPGLLTVNKKHRKPSQANIFSSTQYRIPPAVKPDIEAAATFKVKGQDYLLLIPSFSAPNRNKPVVMHFENKTIGKANELSQNFPSGSGLPQINIEGATQVEEKLLLSNRGNFSAPQNHLLLARFDLDKGLQGWEKIMRIKLPQTKHFAGISGLYYVEEKDLLLFTASTEITESATADGAIGDSYLGIVSNLSNQLKKEEVIADTMINLTPILRSKTPQKIESVAVESIKGNTLLLHLAADNDNGQSTLFRLRLKL